MLNIRTAVMDSRDYKIIIRTELLEGDMVEIIEKTVTFTILGDEEVQAYRE
jgi:hypothetical protein